MRQVVLGAVIAFAVTVAVFSFLSPKPDPHPMQQPAASNDAGIPMIAPVVRELRFMKGNSPIQRIARPGMLSEDAGLPDAATP